MKIEVGKHYIFRDKVLLVVKKKLNLPSFSYYEVNCLYPRHRSAYYIVDEVRNNSRPATSAEVMKFKMLNTK